MTNKVIVLALSDFIEEVVVQVDEFSITCFANVCPYKLEVNKVYSADFDFTILDDWILEENEFIDEGDIIQADPYSQYYLHGRLNGDILEVGNIKFQDDVFLIDYAYLNGKFISLLVDRINIEFL